ncbi:PP2C family protein-serine/threonine phosphatase [Nonomuraea thailandensis]
MRYQPAADNIEVGGDFYEVLPIGDRVLVAIGDVEGHSLHAATVMAELRHAMRASFIGQVDLSASLDLLNQMMRRYHPRMTATLCLMLIDPATGEVEVANAGHIPPLFAGPGGTYHHLGNLLLGALPETYTVDRLKLPPGGTLLLFTDGLVEDRAISLDESLERARSSPRPSRTTWRSSPSACWTRSGCARTTSRWWPCAASPDPAPRGQGRASARAGPGLRWEPAGVEQERAARRVEPPSVAVVGQQLVRQREAAAPGHLARPFVHVLDRRPALRPQPRDQRRLGGVAPGVRPAETMFAPRPARR